MRALLSFPVIAAAIVLIVAVGAFRYQKPLPALAVTELLPDTTTPVTGQANVPWPASGSAAVAVDGLGVVASMHDEQPKPIASVTKIMTAYLILKDKPLQKGETGPTITVTAADAALYNKLISQDESVVAVSTGEKISEYDLLQGLLIASGNNFASMLGAWDLGTTDAFVQKMNATAKTLGMTHTSYADASGASNASVSTAGDQLLLAQGAMTNPVFAEIVAKKSASVPIAGSIDNVDTILGHQGIVGVKTGWTEDAGGCFVFAAPVQVQGRSVMVYGAVIGQDTLQSAFDASEKLVPGIAANLHYAKVIEDNAPVATVQSGWGKSTRILVDGEADMLVWPGQPVQTALTLNQLNVPLKAPVDLGNVNVQGGQQQTTLKLKLESSLPGPSSTWRLIR